MPMFLIHGTLSLLFTGAGGKDESPHHHHPRPGPLQAGLRERASPGPSTAPTQPLPPLPQLSALESALGSDKRFPLHMSEQPERGIPDCSWPPELGCVQTPPVEEPCPGVPPPSPFKLTFLPPRNGPETQHASPLSSGVRGPQASMGIAGEDSQPGRELCVVLLAPSLFPGFPRSLMGHW